MKKIKLLCWLLALCLCLTACVTQIPDTTIGTAAPTTQVTTEATTEATVEATTAPTLPPRTSMVEGSEGIKNIILIIGDGMGYEHLEAGQLYDGIEYDFTKWQTVSITTAPITYSGEISNDPTDSAASATAMATGHLTVNNYLGMLTDGTELQTIMDIVSALGKATGVVTTDSLLGATPAGFSAHCRSRSADKVIAETQIYSGVNLLCGSQDSICIGKAEQIQEIGYAYCQDYSQLSGTFDSDMAYWQLPLAGTEAEVNLVDVAIDALNYLDQDPDGFVLMIEQAHIDKYCHNKNFLDTCKSVSNLNDTVEAVLSWLGDRTDTAVLITADHESGGLVVGGQGEYANTLEGAPSGDLLSYQYNAGGHTSANVALFVHGITADFTKSELYQEDVLKNTGIFFLMLDILNIH